jgi:hypothetical protein
MVPAFVSSASAASGPVGYNATCSQLLGGSAYEIKVDPVVSGVYGPVTATFKDDKKLLDYTSTVGLDGVFVKGGTGGGGYFYDYRPGTSTADNNMGVAGYNNGAQQISHVSFCWEEPPVAPLDLTAQKTAVGTYDRTVEWELEKTVDIDYHSGLAGQTAGTSTWTVTATKSEELGNYSVAGVISIQNPNAFQVDFTVTDVLTDINDVEVGTGVVDCDPVTAGAQAFGTLAGNGDASCTYVAAVTDDSAVLNTAYVDAAPPDVADAEAPAVVSFTENVVGDDEVEVDDDRNTTDFPATTSSSDTWTYTESFECSANIADYTNGFYTYDVPNLATLTGDTTYLEDDALVTVDCTYPEEWKGETATGDGYPWSATKSAPKNWFMYTPYAAGPTDLIAGQHYDAGDITMSRNGTTEITIALHNGFRFADSGNNVKIQPMSCTTNQKYVSPGKFEVKRTADQADSSITVSGLTNTDCYGIHVDVERLIS